MPPNILSHNSAGINQAADMVSLAELWANRLDALSGNACLVHLHTLLVPSSPGRFPT